MNLNILNNMTPHLNAISLTGWGVGGPGWPALVEGGGGWAGWQERLYSPKERTCVWSKECALNRGE